MTDRSQLFAPPWAKLKTAVDSAVLIIEANPPHLAPLGVLLQRAQELLASPPSRQAVAELAVFLDRVEEFVGKWRPTGAAFYVPPPWAVDMERILGAARSFLLEQSASATIDEAKQESKAMKLFVSHSSADQEIAAAFVDLLRAALLLSAKDIRCTSVDGYRLPSGATSDDQLRQEVFECTSFVALLSPSSIKSVYVLFELGARWGAKRHLAPIMIAGLDPSFLKAPLNAVHAVRGSSDSDILQLIEDMAARLSIAPENPSAYMRALQRFTDAAKSPLTP